MNRILPLLLVAALGVLPCVVSAQATAAPATGSSTGAREQVKGLDEQVQDIKKDVLGISSELQVLEEKLLYPSNTQVSLFVTLRGEGKLRLDALSIKVDGQETEHHVYTYKELEALQEGGVQRLHTGNVRTGEHALEVTLVGKSGDAEVHQVASFKFTKAVEPKLLELVVDRSAPADRLVQFKE